MQIQLLGQGYEPISEFSVGNQLIKFLSDKNFHSFTAISAFTSQAGINGLAKYIDGAKKHLKIITIVTGIDQRGTSKEALEALLDLKIDTYIFFAPSPFPIFHPKIYLFEGNEKSQLIIGSSNLTIPGLFNNVETSLLIGIDNNIDADKNIVEQLKEYFSGIFKHSDPNLKKITTKVITDLVKAKVIPTEAERQTGHEKINTEERTETQNIISRIFPKRAIAQIPSGFKGNKTQNEKVKKGDTTIKPPIINKASKLLWESGPLTERDLTIPKGKNTHQTGSMHFKKGLMEGIDQRHFFRDDVFSKLDWIRDPNPRLKHLERAEANFKIIILGEEMGDFELHLSHNTNKNSITYKQNNCMTSLIWGEARPLIAKKELIGLNAQLYKSRGKKNEFILEIK